MVSSAEKAITPSKRCSLDRGDRVQSKRRSPRSALRKVANDKAKESPLPKQSHAAIKEGKSATNRVKKAPQVKPYTRRNTEKSL